MHKFYRVRTPEEAWALNSCGLLWQSWHGGTKEPCTVPRGRVLSWWEREAYGEYQSQYSTYYKRLEH